MSRPLLGEGDWARLAPVPDPDPNAPYLLHIGEVTRVSDVGIRVTQHYSGTWEEHTHLPALRDRVYPWGQVAYIEVLGRQSEAGCDCEYDEDEVGP